jgi:hypothetical protein
MIECMTDGCVNPHVSYYDRATAVVRWNNRIAGPRITVEDAEILKASAL